MFTKMNYKLSALAVAAMLAACGGDGDGGGNGASPAQGSVKLSGQVVDGPIEGAKVCLFVDGATAAICSGNTDAEGKYSLMVPRSLDGGLLTLHATRGDGVHLVSALGTLEQVLDAAGSSDAVTAADLPAVRVTHFTTADFVLADTDHDGILSAAEHDAYVPDFTASQNVAGIIKAVVDFGAEAGALLNAEISDTLALAVAAARGDELGTTGQTAEQWLADPKNTKVVEAIQKDLTDSVASKFARYQFTTTVTSENIGTPVSGNGGTATMHCTSPIENDSEVVEIALDAQLGIMAVKYTDDVTGESGQILGSFNAKTGEIKMQEVEPRHVSFAGNNITYYSEGTSTTLGKFDAKSGTITGTSLDSVTNSWTLNSATVTCTGEGTFKAVKL